MRSLHIGHFEEAKPSEGKNVCCRQHRHEPEVERAEHLSQHFLDIVKDVVAILAIQAAEVGKNRATHAVHYAPTGFNPMAFGY